jgi:hypothetical protein
MLGNDTKNRKSEILQWIFILGLVLAAVFFGLFKKNEYVKAEFHFGRNYYPSSQENKVKEVSKDDFFQFIDDYVTPLFPEGLTTTESSGQMFDGKKLEKQDNFELIIIHKNTTGEKEKLDKVAQEYKKRFIRSQVLVYTYDVEPVFYNKQN